MKTAMIFAAGRGERLRPLTNIRPKALCIVNEYPIIEHHINKLAQIGIERILINHAYLGSQIRHYLGNGAKWQLKIYYAPEPPGALETGGAVYNALPLLGNEPFIAVNADILCDFDYSALQLKDNNLGHLVLVQGKTVKKDFGLTSKGKIIFKKTHIFSGIACYHPRAFVNLKPGRYSIVPILYKLIQQHLLGGEIYKGKWIDIGSLGCLKIAQNFYHNINL